MGHSEPFTGPTHAETLQASLMRTYLITLQIMLLAAAPLGTGWSAPRPAPSRPAVSSRTSSTITTAPRLPVVEHRLKNGMKFLIVERHDSPTVAAFIRFKVGGVDDPAGQT